MLFCLLSISIFSQSKITELNLSIRPPFVYQNETIEFELAIPITPQLKDIASFNIQALEGITMNGKLIILEVPSQVKSKNYAVNTPHRITCPSQGYKFAQLKIKLSANLSTPVAILNQVVTQKVKTWIKKDEFETDLQYHDRLLTKEETIKSFIRTTTDSLEEVALNVLKQELALRKYFIGNYHANAELFPLKLGQLDTILVKIPITVAREFKQAFIAGNVSFFNSRLSLKDNNWVIQYIEINAQSKNFVYSRDDAEKSPAFYPIVDLPADLLSFSLPSSDPENDPKKNKTAVFDTYDIRANIPIGQEKVGLNSVAIIIANRDYAKNGGISNVDYALEDGRLMKEYLIKVFGYQEGNVLVFENAAKGTFETIFGTETNPQGRLSKIVAPNGQSQIFIYYSGHGSPGGFNDDKPYFVPVECPPNEVSLAGYPLATFYKNLAKIPAKEKTVVIDACFSGRDVIKNVSSVGIRTSTANPQDQNTIVFTSSKADQPANWYTSKKQGLFTYCFLKAIHDYKNTDTNRDGHISYDEIFQRVSDQSNGVPYLARRIGQPDQTPSLLGEGKNRSFLELKF